MLYQIEYRAHPGDSAEDAFNTLIETELFWFQEYNVESVFLDYKRYKIVSTDQFASREDALSYINANLPFKMRAKSAGCVIINNKENIEYLFFNHGNIKEKS